jgi:hypothetical protein
MLRFERVIFDFGTAIVLFSHLDWNFRNQQVAGAQQKQSRFSRRKPSQCQPKGTLRKTRGPSDHRRTMSTGTSFHGPPATHRQPTGNPPATQRQPNGNPLKALIFTFS